MKIRELLHVIPQRVRIVALVLGCCVVLTGWVVAGWASAHGDGSHAVSLYRVAALVLGVAVAVWVLGVAYVYADAHRRAMRPVLCVLLVILFPHLLGFLLYFVMRQPIATTCPQCGMPVTPDQRFCSNCGQLRNAEDVQYQPSMKGTQQVKTSLKYGQGISLRQAALVVGFTYLLNTTVLAEHLFGRLVVSGNPDETFRNLASHRGTFAGAILAYLFNFLGDIVFAWARYYLLAPVNRAVSLLAAMVQLVYACLALFATMHLITVWNLVYAPEYQRLFGTAQLQAQIDLLLNAFRSEWSLSLAFFGFQLMLVGWLIFKSTYVPRAIGILLLVNGLGWMIDSLGPYVAPSINLNYVQISLCGELVFMLWLWFKAWSLPAEIVDTSLG